MKSGMLLPMIILVPHIYLTMLCKKYKDIWTKEDKENVQHGLKVKTIITTAIGIVEFLCASHCNTA